ncbi:3-dehydroquinate synthase [Photobacterium halotolerans]|uniref:3-dehydroquinate synthase n=1 Tax=Photobacterium halotolerans TaxID=265726 RepID=UPI00061988B9|nr:3-dehydroquinate synthase [Photobacterium halotolerans]
MDTFQRTGTVLLLYCASVMALITISFLLFEQDAMGWVSSAISQLSGSHGSGLFLLFLFVVVILAFDIVLPVPSSVVAMFAVTALGPLPGAASVWLGLTLGCCVGYWLGDCSEKWMGTRWLSVKERQKARQLADKMGGGALIMMRGVPVLAETSVIAAGMLGYPFAKFLLFTSLANGWLAGAFAYVSLYSAESDPFFLVVAGSVLIPVIGWLLHRFWQRVTPVSAVSSTSHTQPSATEIETIKARFTVQYQYPVCFTHDVFSPSNSDLLTLLLRARREEAAQGCVLIVDQGVVNESPDWLERAQAYFQQHQQYIHLKGQPLVVKGGEAIKQVSQTDLLYQYLLNHQVDRHNVVIAVGGGAVLDTVGYVCATFHRGIQLLRMPSTVLAQNDAGIGVKNGVNGYGSKNLIGTFCPPFAVLNDFSLLNTLSYRDRRAGLAEAVKVAAIRSGEFFDWLENNAHSLNTFDDQATQYAIARCAELHINQITLAGDPFETGNARPLDYGHWAAHKLEAMSHYECRHGEAVAIGMALDAYYAAEIGLMSQGDLQRLIQLLTALGFALWHPALDRCDELGQPVVFQGLEDFRQHLGGQLCVTLLSSVGVGVEVHDIDADRLLGALRALKREHQAEVTARSESLTLSEVG